jgi:hypothetical protein
MSLVNDTTERDEEGHESMIENIKAAGAYRSVIKESAEGANEEKNESLVERM